MRVKLILLPLSCVWMAASVAAIPPASLDVCRWVAAKLASVTLSECRQRQLRVSGAVSVNNTPIMVKEYPPLAGRMPKARILVIGGIHGDEYSSVSVVLKWMKILDRYHSGLFHWQFVPLLNPDGLLRRKSQRTNTNGVDLNRNFPTPNWIEETRRYWIKKTRRNPRRYPGVAPLSEPESRWLAGFIHRFQPQAIVSVHAPHGVVDYDGPPEAPHRLGYLHRNLMGTYPGSLGNYAGVQLGIPVITLELPSAGIMPPGREIRRLWVDLVRWLRVNIPRAVTNDNVVQAGPS